MVNIINDFDVGSNAVQIGAALFGNNVSPQFQLNTYRYVHVRFKLHLFVTVFTLENIFEFYRSSLLAFVGICFAFISKWSPLSHRLL